MNIERSVENRRHVRHVVSPRLYVAMNGSSSGGILHDLSDGGLSLDVVGAKPAEEHFLIDFELSETGEHFEGGVGKVVWQDAAGNRIGLQFVNLPDELRQKVKNWLISKSSSPEVLQAVMVLDRGDVAGLETPAKSLERSEAAIKPTARIETTSIASVANATPATSAPVLEGPKIAVRQKVSAPNLAKTAAGTNIFEGTVLLASPRKHSFAGRANRLKRKLWHLMDAQNWKSSVPWLRISAMVFLGIVLLTVMVRLSRLSGESGDANGQSFISKLLRPAARPAVRTSSTSLTVRFERPKKETATATWSLSPSPVAKNYSASLGSYSEGNVEEGQDNSTGELPFEEPIPQYPMQAVNENVQGRVVLHGTIDTHGVLRDVSVISGPPILSEAALEAVKKWRYLPHYQNSKPVEVESQITVDFVLVER